MKAKSANVSEMLEGVKISIDNIQKLRSDEEFHKIYTAAHKKGEHYELDSLEFPRKRFPPKRYSDKGSQQ